MTDLRSVELWEAVAADLRRHRLRRLTNVMTEDVVRFATAQALVDRGADPDELHVDRPHPELSGRRIDLVLGDPPTGQVDFRFPRDPDGENAVWPSAVSELLADFHRLATYAGDLPRILVYLESEPLRRYMLDVTDRTGIRLDADRITLRQSAVNRLPSSAAQVVRPGFTTRPVNADRLCFLRVGGDMLMHVYDVEVVQPDFAARIAIPSDQVRSTARREILAAVEDITTRSGNDTFTLGEVVAELRRRGTSYAESTIRTMVSAHMCADAPVNAATTYDDFTRLERGVYRLARKPPRDGFDNERVEGFAELQDLLRHWVDETDRPTLADVPPFGGRPVVHIRLGGTGFHLNADTKRQAVLQFLDAAVRAGGADRLPWWVIPNRNGRLNLVSFRPDRQPVAGWYAYLDNEVAREGPLGQALAPE